MSQAYQPLHHKYRPERFDDLVGQGPIVATLKQALITKRIAPAYLFSGPRGTGKTSSARILARSLNCLKSNTPTQEPCGICEICKSISTGTSLDVIEIDAASNTGVDNIRELIERSRFAPVQARWKVYVIDECHMLSTAAFNALLKTLEEPPPRVVFVLATTDPQRVLPTILSRCQRFEFRPIPQKILEKHLEFIASSESILIESKALSIIAQKAQGGLRDAESMLDQLSLLPTPIKTESVWELLGAVPEEELISIAMALTNTNPIDILESCRNLVDIGREPMAILQGVTSILRDLVVLNAAPNRPELSSFSSDFHVQLIDLSNQIGIKKLLQWQSKLKGSEYQLRQSTQPRLWIEVLLLGLLAEEETATQTKLINSKQVTESLPLVQELKNQSIKPSNEITQQKANENVNQEINLNHEKQHETTNLSEIWEKILAQLELPSTRMLLSQQAKLVQLTPQQAIIQVSENWIGMVQSRIMLLEQAITKALGSPRKLIVENQNEPNKSDSTNFSKNIPNKIKQKPEIHTNISQASNQAGLQSNSSQNHPKKTIKSELNEGEKSDHVKGIDEKIKKLADFFNGSILEIED